MEAEEEKRDEESGERKKSFDVPLSDFSRSRKSLDAIQVGSGVSSNSTTNSTTTSPARAIEKKNLHQGMVGLDMTPFHQWDGYMEKKGTLGGGRRRYFILVNSFITYYADLAAFQKEPLKNLRGSYNIRLLDKMKPINMNKNRTEIILHFEDGTMKSLRSVEGARKLEALSRNIMERLAWFADVKTYDQSREKWHNYLKIQQRDKFVKQKREITIEHERKITEVGKEVSSNHKIVLEKLKSRHRRHVEAVTTQTRELKKFTNQQREHFDKLHREAANLRRNMEQLLRRKVEEEERESQLEEDIERCKYVEFVISFTHESNTDINTRIPNTGTI